MLTDHETALEVLAGTGVAMLNCGAVAGANCDGRNVSKVKRGLYSLVAEVPIPVCPNVLSPQQKVFRAEVTAQLVRVPADI